MDSKQRIPRRRWLQGSTALAAVAGLAKLGHAQVADDAEKPAADPDYPIVDCHCHAGDGWNSGKPGPQDPWTVFNDPEGTIRKMDQAGIDRTVIFPIHNRTYKEANEAIAGFVKRWPTRFIGFAKHDGETEAGKIADMLRHEINNLGLSGLKLHGTPTEEMMTTAAELKIPILFHPKQVDDCHVPVRSHPEVNFILAHLGSFSSKDWREHDLAIAATDRYRNLYLETSSVVFFRYLEKAAELLSPEKLLFGSDGPLVDARLELQKVRLLNLPTETQRLVLGGNILRLLGDHA